MSLQTINIGSTANDGTGDKVRDAFNKINTNFAFPASASAMGMMPAADKGKLDNIYKSVKDFGAIGNGTNDDTDAIQAAISSGVPVLFFPAGTYKITDSLVPASNQIWRGCGTRTVIRQPAANHLAGGFHMVSTAGDLSNWGCEDIAFRGNLDVQTTAGSTNGGLNLRGGSVSNVWVTGCTFSYLGDQTKASGFGIIVGCAVNGASGKTLERVRITDCEFRSIANVPGVYFGDGSGDQLSTFQNIEVSNCRFINATNYARQNCVYVRGTLSCPARQISISDNKFSISQSIDVCIELNYAPGAIVYGNDILVSGSADCTGVLVRSQSANFRIVNNTVNNIGLGCLSSHAIAVLNFDNSETQTDFVVSGNTITDFGASGVLISRICYRALVIDNVISGITRRGGSAFVIGGSIGITLAGNKISNTSQLVILSDGGIGTCRQLLIERNHLLNVGSAGGWAIDSSVANQNVTNVCVRQNIWVSAPTGTNGLWNAPYLAATGNRCQDNDIPAGLSHVNNSYAAYVQNVVTPAGASGERLVGLKYSFAQGGIDMLVAPGSGWPWSHSFGANLDGSAPNCVPGDAIIVGCSANLTGAVVSGFVPEKGKLRIQIANVTQDNLGIAAGTWYVIFVKF